MMWMLFSPIGRYIAIAVAGICLVGGVYLKIKSDVRSEITGEMAQDALKRVQDAVRASDSLDTDIGRLRNPDRDCRDCR